MKANPARLGVPTRTLTVAALLLALFGMHGLSTSHDQASPFPSPVSASIAATHGVVAHTSSSPVAAHGMSPAETATAVAAVVHGDRGENHPDNYDAMCLVVLAVALALLLLGLVVLRLRQTPYPLHSPSYCTVWATDSTRRTSLSLTQLCISRT